MDDSAKLIEILREKRDRIADKIDATPDIPWWARAAFRAVYLPEWRLELVMVNGMIARRLTLGDLS